MAVATAAAAALLSDRRSPWLLVCKSEALVCGEVGRVGYR